MINVKSVRKSGTGISVSWDNGFPNVLSLSIVFDDEGSCTTIGLTTDATSFTAKNLSRHRTYDIYLKALTPDGWVSSESRTYRLE